MPSQPFTSHTPVDAQSPAQVDAQKLIDTERLIGEGSLTSRQVVAMVICVLLTMIDGFDLQAIAFAGPEIARQWHLPSAALGPVFSVGLVGGLLGGFVIAPLSDVYGPKRVLVLSLALLMGMTLATAYTSNLSQLLLVRGLAGIGLGGALPSVLALLSSYAPDRLKATFVIVGVCGQVGGAALGGAVASQLISTQGWPSIFLFGGVLPLILLPVVMGLLPESLPHLTAKGDVGRIQKSLRALGKANAIPPGAGFLRPERPPEISPNVLISDGRGQRTLVMTLASLLGITFFYFSVNWLPTVLRDSGASAEQAVLGSVALNLGGMVGAISIGLLARRHAVTSLVAIGMCIGALLLCAVATIRPEGDAMLALIFSVGVFGIGSMLSQILITLSLYPPYLHCTAIGLQLGVGRIGAVTGPLIGSVLLLITARPERILFFPAFCAVASALFIFMIARLIASSAPQTAKQN